ncbi:hypothetical protein Ae406Ps2_2395 [Pseudonocardia sp. Ae406_Ps2]|nr:hypothetical protein Ae331Ps2_3522c [Pseudonocardia sp. Ae331_Ps2]OLM02395.1 hypothetical protein Ae406Ps2_2395 [Pseudonocardia sp. Ae406_Ps2]OLM12769.1 hypothetical protein Ae505Ps2_2897c [Pseudonocardia sp. Ae505_Ps2]
MDPNPWVVDQFRGRPSAVVVEPQPSLSDPL